MSDPLIILDPHPRQAQAIFDAEQRARLERLGRIVECDSRLEPERFDRLLQDVTVILGQPDLPHDRLARAPGLRTLIEVEGNFPSNVDYAACFEAGITVLSIAPAFAASVAELALGLALDLARGIILGDRAMREGCELYGSKGNAHASLLSRSQVGIIGYGAIGRAIRRLLAGFHCEVAAYDAWLPGNALRDDEVLPATLAEVLERSDVIFVSAAATSENAHLLGRAELEMLQPHQILVLVSRAAIVDFEALISLVDQGRFRAATDVFPIEPVAPTDRIRRSRLLLSPHRGGGMRPALATAAEMILDDLDLILRGLPPVRLQQARRETACRLRSKPASYK